MRTENFVKELLCIIVLCLISGVLKGVNTVTDVYSASLHAVADARQSAPPTYIPVTGVSIKVDTVIMEEGDRGILAAHVYPINATYNAINWYSNDPSVVTVYAGELEARAIGTATIKVTTFDGGFTDTCIVQVVEKEHETLMLDIKPGGSGTISGISTGRYKIGSPISVKAIPNTGYEFKHWMVNGDVVSTNIDYSFTLTTKTILTAVFQPAKTHVTLTLSASPSEGGKIVYGGGVFDFGTGVFVGAEANEGYTFKYWEVNGVVVSTKRFFSFELFVDTELVAVFEESNGEVEEGDEILLLNISPIRSGTISGISSGRYKIGSPITVKAVPATGYEFKHWMINGDVVSTDTDFAFTLTTLTTLTAVFHPAKIIVTLTVGVSPSGGGQIVQGGGDYYFGTGAYVQAKADEGYVFKHWEVNGVVVSTGSVFSYEMFTDTELVAVFEKDDTSSAELLSGDINIAANGGTLRIQSNKELKSVVVYAVNGLCLYQDEIKNNEVKISGLPKGLLIVTIDGQMRKVMMN